MSTNYKLRQCIDGHDNDVKSLCVLPEFNGFLSASRDLSVRLWKDENKNFKQLKQFIFHKSYISVVYYLKPSVCYPDGIIFSAGYDKVINGYVPITDVILFSLPGHTNTVTSITSNLNGDLISGSMDGTAILWDLNTSAIKQTYKGHKHGIWSVIILNCKPNHFLTASADKEIFLWSLDKKNSLMKYLGHTDCVRGLVEISNANQFLSCSNDNTIRLWSLHTGSCISVFYGHTSFIYSLARISDDKFVSCGENGLVCVWNINDNNAPIQTISLLAQSVWCVSAFANGDIVTGSSDGIIRLFTEDISLQNGVEIKPKIRNVIDDSIVDSLASVGIEYLSIPGNYNHQLLKVRDEGNDILYEWSSSQDLWIKKKILTPASANGAVKSHDYTFSIDIKDGEPPLKLFYNMGQDPWIVAKQFLDDNDLSAMFLDQVANFIMTNSNQQVPTSSLLNEFSDPFTGGNRYVPSQLPNTIDNEKQFPRLSYLRYDQINATGLLKKVNEIAGNNLPDDINKYIENIQNLSTEQSISLCEWVLDKHTSWPEDQLFPLIDILRILVRELSCNTLCFSTNEFLAKLLLKTMGSNASQLSKGNILTTVKLLVNGFLQIPGEKLINQSNKQIAEALNNVIQSSSDKNTLIAVSSWLLNMSVFINLRNEEFKRIEILNLSFGFLKIFETNNCMEAIHRTLVSIGTLVCNIESFSFRETLTMDVFEKINTFSKCFNDANKWSKDIQVCSQQLGLLISSLDFLNF